MIQLIEDEKSYLHTKHHNNQNIFLSLPIVLALGLCCRPLQINKKMETKAQNHKKKEIEKLQK